MSEASAPRAAEFSPRRFLNHIAQSWNAFWFTPADPAPLCLMRILVGGMLFYSHYVWGLEFEAFFGAEGFSSAELIRFVHKDSWAYSFWWSVPSAWFGTVHVLCLAIIAAFWLGLWTRITSVLAVLIHASYCNRAPLATFGMDQIAAILAFYLMIGPSGTMYSLDRLLRRRSGLEETQIKYLSAGLALRLIQVHYCIIYFFAGVSKLQGRTWWTGEALWRAFANYEYQSVDMTWLASYPWLIQLLTLTAVLWEISFPYLIWQRAWRPLLLGVGMLIHLGIGALLGMWTFGLTMIFGYLAFVRPETVRRWAKALGV